jgi:hypothetical protein
VEIDKSALDKAYEDIPRYAIDTLRKIKNSKGPSSTEYHEYYKYVEKEVYCRLNDDLKLAFFQLPAPRKPDVDVDPLTAMYEALLKTIRSTGPKS